MTVKFLGLVGSLALSFFSKSASMDRRLRSSLNQPLEVYIFSDLF